MIKALESVDRTTAAGLLARAALSLGYDDNPSAHTNKSDAELLARIIKEARNRLGLSIDDNGPEAFEQIASFLDEESDKLLTPPDTRSALNRLAERGDLPSDLYEIFIVANVADIYGKQFPLEKQIIETTIRAPSLEQHFGPVGKPHEPTMISLFMRTFRTKWPLRDFVELVAAERHGFQLFVHQAWRIYPRNVNVAGATSPVDWLRRFSDTYGADIDVEGRRGHFFLMASGPIPNSFRISHTAPGAKPYHITVSRFSQKDPETGSERSALIVAINIEKYLHTLHAMAVRREDILDAFVPAPRPRE